MFLKCNHKRIDPELSGILGRAPLNEIGVCTPKLTSIASGPDFVRTTHNINIVEWHSFSHVAHEINQPLPCPGEKKDQQMNR